MNQNKKPIIIKDPQKIYFFFFMVLSLIILLIFAFIIIGYYWDNWQTVKNIEKYYSQRSSEILQKFPQINLQDPALGEADAKVTIFEYSDFLCPICQNVQADLSAIEKFYGNKIRIVFKGVILNQNPEGKNAMLAAYCAAEQNKFWEYKDLLFQNPTLLNIQTCREYASQLNLNLDTFNQCLEAQKYYPILQQNLADTLNLQINSLPTLYVNKQKIEGYFNFETLKNIIDQELK